MIRVSAVLAACFLALPLRADPLPQGEFMLGTYIWPGFLLPRYASLRIEGEALALDFLSPLPLDFTACEQEGDCFFETTAARARVRLDDGRVVLEAVEIDAAARIDPDNARRIGQPDRAFYTAPLLGLVQGAILTETPEGFRLETGGQALDFFRAEGEARRAATILPLLHEQSIALMAACEVRAILPLYLKPDPDDAERRFLNVLAGAIHRWELDNEYRRLAPMGRGPLPGNEARAREVMLAGRLPMMIATLQPEHGDARLETFWEDVGRTLFGEDRAAFDAVIAGYGESLPDLVAFHRYVREAAPEITPETVCADPGLGFME